MAIVVEIRGYKNFLIDKGDRLKVLDIYKELGLNSEEFVPLKDDKIITEYDEVRDGEVLVLYPVISIG